MIPPSILDAILNPQVASSSGGGANLLDETSDLLLDETGAQLLDET